MGALWTRVVPAILAALLSGTVAAQPAAKPCDIPAELVDDDSPLPNAAAAIKQTKSLKIVVLGSASSLGSGATNTDSSWPRRLEVHLAARLPGATVRVVNRSAAGQSARRMAGRLVSDVIAEKPQVVVWQTGTAEAVRTVEPDTFIATLLEGIDQLQAAGIDVMLMDPQYSRPTARMINFQPYVDGLDKVARMRDLVMIPRFAIMRHWIDSGQLSFEDVPRAQAAALADRVYDCIGRIVADLVTARVRQ